MNSGDEVLVILPSPYGPIALTAEQLQHGLERADSLHSLARPNATADETELHAQSDPLVDAQTAAQILGVKSSWLLQRAREGRIPHVRLGKYVRFNIDEVCRAFRQDEFEGQ